MSRNMKIVLLVGGLLLFMAHTWHRYEQEHFRKVLETYKAQSQHDASLQAYKRHLELIAP